MLLTAVVYIAFVVLLVVVAVIDARTLRIPNECIVMLGGLWIAWRLLLGFGGLLVGTDFITSAIAPAPFKGVSLADGLIGAVFLGGGLLVVTAAYEALFKKRAMGGGDIKLLIVVGLFLGLERGLLCLLAACAFSLIFSLVAPRAKWGRKARAAGEDEAASASAWPQIMKEVPFAPALALGSVTALLVV